MKINIAIDGYSSCGKGTLAKALAAKLEYRFIDSGAMYRGVTLAALRAGLDMRQEQPLLDMLPNVELEFAAHAGRQNELFLNGSWVEEEIRKPQVAAHVSWVASLPAVRERLVAEQRRMGLHKGIVMDGRDIGTVVFPDAELKIFMTARPEVRAQRRFDESQKKGIEVSFQEVFDNLQERDRIDSSRDHSPLTLTDDYRVLDNSDLNPTQQLELALSWVDAILVNLR
ncbi:MAG: (d)CMP kinase [Bacteroidia bacterium]